MRLAPEDIIGAIEPATGPRGGAAYTVSYDLAELPPSAPRERPTPVFARHGRLDGLFFPTVTAAARWLDEHAAAPVPSGGGRTA